MIDINKKYRYDNGLQARILCVDAPGLFPVIAITNHGGLTQHHLDGRSRDPLTGLDLIEVREPLECWIYVSPDSKEMGSCAEHRKPPNPNFRKFREVID
jgi:hypothetical protein